MKPKKTTSVIYSKLSDEFKTAFKIWLTTDPQTVTLQHFCAEHNIAYRVASQNKWIAARKRANANVNPHVRIPRNVVSLDQRIERLVDTVLDRLDDPLDDVATKDLLGAVRSLTIALESTRKGSDQDAKRAVREAEKRTANRFAVAIGTACCADCRQRLDAALGLTGEVAKKSEIEAK